MKPEQREMVGACCVCSDSQGWDVNPLVYCDGPDCQVAVHQGCYGIVTVPEDSWYCARCSASASDARCVLCPQLGGALKHVASNGWAHVVCALYLPEVEFGDVHSMEPVVVDKVPEWRFQAQCCLCDQRRGACTQCNRSQCKKFFHVTCAQKLQLLREEGVGTQNVKYCGYCPTHARPTDSPIAQHLVNGQLEATVPQTASQAAAANAGVDLAMRSTAINGPTSIEPMTSACTMPPTNPIDVLPSTDALSNGQTDKTSMHRPAKRGRPPGSSTNREKPPSVESEEKAKKPRKNHKRTVKTLLELVDPVVQDTVSDFQRERAAQRVTQSASLASGQEQLTSSLAGFSAFTEPYAAMNFGQSGGPLKPTPKLATTLLSPDQPSTSQAFSQSGISMNSGTYPASLEQLLERQWEMGSQFLMEQSQYFDISSLLTLLYQLKQENKRIEQELTTLSQRKEHLIAVNARLATTLGSQAAQSEMASPIGTSRQLDLGLVSPRNNGMSMYNGPSRPSASSSVKPDVTATGSLSNFLMPRTTTPLVANPSTIASYFNQQDSAAHLILQQHQLAAYTAALSQAQTSKS